MWEKEGGRVVGKNKFNQRKQLFVVRIGDGSEGRRDRGGIDDRADGEMQEIKKGRGHRTALEERYQERYRRVEREGRSQ